MASSWQAQFTAEQKAYYKAITRFIDRPFFGLTKRDKKTPYHVNGAHDPLADDFFNSNTLKVQRRQRLLKHKDVANHFASGPHQWGLTGKWSFLVNSYGKQVHLHAIDIDFDPDQHGDHSDALALAALIASDLFCGVPVFVEPSRNRHGAYVWFMMRRTLDGIAYNALLNDMTAYLKDRYKGRFDAQVDAIKGTVQFFAPNPEFDFEAWTDKGIAYEKAKKTYDWRFEPNPKLEPHIHHRGVLVTMPCAGVENFQPERLPTFLKWVKDDNNVVDEKLFTDLLKRPAAAAVQDDQRPVLHAKSPHLSIPKGENRAWAMLKSPDAWMSSIGACFYASQVLGHAATPEEACAMYEQHGAATGPRTPERLDRMQRILHKLVWPTFEPAKHKGDPHWFTPEDREQAERLVRSKFSKAKLKRVCRQFGCRITYDMVALALCTFRKDILTNHGEVPYKALRGMFRHFGLPYNNLKIRAMLEVLMRIRLVACRDLSDYEIGTAEKRGRCRRYELVCPTPSPEREGGEERDKSIGTTGHTLSPSPEAVERVNPPQDAQIVSSQGQPTGVLRETTGTAVVALRPHCAQMSS